MDQADKNERFLHWTPCWRSSQRRCVLIEPGHMLLTSTAGHRRERTPYCDVTAHVLSGATFSAIQLKHTTKNNGENNTKLHLQKYARIKTETT